MQSKNRVLKVVVFALMLLPLGIYAQNSGLNTFSPYTMYGLGDLSTPGTASLRSMGGAGVAYSSPFSINYLNPAASSTMRRESFLFNFGLEGQNFYNSSNNSKNSHNTFNIRDVAVQFPIYKNIAFTVSMTPYSSIGYNITKEETDPDIIGNVGGVKYLYQGEGNVSKFQFALGMKVFEKLALGAQLDYYHGSLERYYSSTISPINGDSYSNMSGLNNELVSKVGGTFGLQYYPITEDNNYLVIGAVYKMGINLDSKITQTLYTNELVSASTSRSNINLPHELSLGTSYITNKFIINADYIYQRWGSNNSSLAYEYGDGYVRYKNTNSFKAGVEYTPNKGDIRAYQKRIAYRLGFKYSDYYMQFNDQNIADKAITMGLGFPLKMAGTTKINLGLELGQRGSLNNNLVKENYFKFSIGLSLFGSAPDDYWFHKQKYD